MVRVFPKQRTRRSAVASPAGGCIGLGRRGGLPAGARFPVIRSVPSSERLPAAGAHAVKPWTGLSRIRLHSRDLSEACILPWLLACKAAFIVSCGSSSHGPPTAALHGAAAA